MRVVYSVATTLGGPGIGTTAYWAVLGIDRAGSLSRVYASDFVPGEIPETKITKTHTAFFERMGFLPSSYQWFLKDNLHDLLVSRRASPVEVFHGWNGHSLFSLKAFRKKGAKVVIERASSHPSTFGRILEAEYQRRGLKFKTMLRLNLKKLSREFEEADFITTPSEFSYRSMIENGLNPKKVVKVPFGVDLGNFRTSPRRAPSFFNALFVGQVGLRKGVLYLLEAWKRLNLPEAKLTIIGQIDEEIYSLLKDYFFLPSVEFISYTNPLPFYQSADVFVFPSLEEGSALVTYEALACGLPVITTLESGSVVENDQEGYIVPSSEVENLMERIRYLYDNRSVVDRMSHAARRKAELYSWESYGKNLLNFYEKIV